MARKVLAVIVGVLAGGTFNMILVTISQAMYPYPEGIDPNDMDAVREHIEANGMPFGALVIVLMAHAGGSLVSGLVCGLIAKKQWIAAAIGLGLWWTLGGVTMLFLLPAPLWFAIVDIALYVPAAIAGVFVGGRLTGAGATKTHED